MSSLCWGIKQHWSRLAKDRKRSWHSRPRYATSTTVAKGVPLSEGRGAIHLYHICNNKDCVVSEYGEIQISDDPLLRPEDWLTVGEHNAVMQVGDADKRRS